MKEITENQLLAITGGGLSIYAIGAIIGGIIFGIGILDGITRPIKCRK